MARAAEWAVEPFVICLTAWLSVLRTYAACDDVVVATLAGSSLLRLTLKGRDPFRAAVAAVAAEVVASRPEARLPLRFGAGPTSAEVVLQIEDVGGSLRLVLEYHRGTLDAALAERLLAHVDVRLAAATARPDTPLKALPLASAEERRQLTSWGCPASAPLAAGTVTELFAEVARARPDGTAIVCGREHVTYHALARRAAAVAVALRAAGIVPGDRVVLQIGRGVRFVAGALGVLRCGAAYVPVDPSEPAARRQRMLEAIKPRLGLRESARPGDDVVQAWLHASVADHEAEAALDAGLDPMAEPAIRGDTAAYVMFTSGSRGLPKGVAVPHRGIARLVRGQSFARMGPDERWLHMAPVTFDASTLEIWAPLLNGGRCVVLDDVVPSPAALDATIRREAVTSAWITSSLFNVLVDEAPGCLAGLKQVLVGGEALSPVHVRRALSALPRLRLINGYGPTENTTFTCCHDITAADVEPGRTVPIGRPIAHTTVRVLDHR
ncbi:MAG: AMP-binding protein, partial [Vicinamibacterales bacterium]